MSQSAERDALVRDLESPADPPAAATAGPDRPDEGVGPPRWTWKAVLVASASYLVLALAVYRNDIFSSGGKLPVCACGDQVQEVWFLRWPLYALAHGHNPLWSNWINFPRGANLALNTTALLLGVVGAPLELLLGPVATYDVLLAFALATSALAMFWVLRRWVHTWWTAWAGGLLYGFSPFMIGQGQSHLFLIAGALVPVLFAIVDDIVVAHRRSPRRAGLLLGVVVVAQYFISPEVLGMTAVVAGCGVVLLALANPGEVRRRARPVASALAYGALLAAVVLAYPIWFSQFGTMHVAGPPHALSDLARYPGDLLGPLNPTQFQRFAPASVKAHGSLLTGSNPGENGMYLGIPLVAVLGWLTWRFRRSGVLRFCTAMVVVSTVLALGPRLTVDGHVTGVPLPFTVLRHMPVFQDILPVRFSLFVQLFAAASLAIGLDMLVRSVRERDPRSPGHARDRGSRRRRGALVSGALPALVAVVALVPLVPAGPYAAASASVPGFFTGPAVDRIPPGSAVLAFPYARSPQLQSVLEQAVAGMRFKLLGGAAFVPGPDGRTSFGPDLLSPSQVQAILYNTYEPDPGPPSDLAAYPPTDPATEATLRAFLSRYSVSTVVVTPSGANPSGAIRYVSAALGPGRRIGGVVAWFDVPRLLRCGSPGCPGAGVAGR